MVLFMGLIEKDRSVLLEII